VKAQMAPTGSTGKIQVRPPSDSCWEGPSQRQGRHVGGPVTPRGLPKITKRNFRAKAMGDNHRPAPADRGTAAHRGERPRTESTSACRGRKSPGRVSPGRPPMGEGVQVHCTSTDDQPPAAPGPSVSVGATGLPPRFRWRFGHAQSHEAQADAKAGRENPVARELVEPGRRGTPSTGRHPAR